MPKHWEIKKLGEVCDVLDNLRKPINSSERQQRISGKNKNELFPYYGATGQVGWIDSFITDGEYILIGEDGAPFLDLFKAKAYKIYGKTWVNNHAHILKGKESIILNDFILYYLNSINYREFVNGTTRLKLTKNNLIDIPFVLPPLPEQQAIVSKIEELLSDLEKGKQQLQTAQQQLKTYRQSLLKWAFEGKLTRPNHYSSDLHDEHDLNMAAESQIEYIKNQGSDNLPKGWNWVTMENVTSKITDGEHLTPKRISQGEMLLSAKNVRDGYIDYSNYDCISKVNFDKCLLRCNPEVGDILIVSVGATIGRASIVKDKMKFALVRSVALLKPNNINSKFLLYYIQSPQTQKRIQELSQGSAQNCLYINKIKQIEIPLTSIKEQQLIVEELESKLTVCDKIEETICHSLQKAETLRQSILKKAFEGRLVNEK